MDDVIYVWANMPELHILPLEVSPSLLDKSQAWKDPEFHSADYQPCLGNYTVGYYSCVQISVTFKGTVSEALLKVETVADLPVNHVRVFECECV